jgi:hypothetical protein
MNLFNEFMVSFYLYTEIGLSTDHYIPPDLRERLGWTLVILMAATIMINIIKAIVFDIKALRIYCRKKHLQKQRSKKYGSESIQ